jgi:hypothetical protein
VCTASWLRRSGELRVCFNRDELEGREPGTAPAAAEQDGVRFLAPRDGRAGGTWIAASDRGLVLALLNRSDGVHPARAGSRGRLIPRLVAARDPDDLAARLLREPLRDLPPFRLASFWLVPARADLVTWNGHHLTVDRLAAEGGMLCSSGLGDERALRERSARLVEARARAGSWGFEELRSFHRSHDPEPSAWSICMHRPDAETVSYAEVALSAAGVRLGYLDGPPCRGGDPVELVLEPSGATAAR